MFMNVSEFAQIEERLKLELDEYRYVHTLGVAFTSASLAMRYEADVDRALLAGLLHDCAKCIPNDEKYALCEQWGVELSEIERRNYSLVHAKLGAEMAKRKYGVEDEEILDAIRTHTTGAPGMSLMQKIVYVADLIEPDRDDRIPDIGRTRAIAFEDIDEAVYIVVRRSIKYLEKAGREIDAASLETFDYYKKIHKKKKK